MALATTISGPGLLISYEPLVRDYFVGFFALVTNFRETVTTEVREWYALTEGAAVTGAGAVQPSSGAYTFIVSESNKQVQAFTLTRYHITTVVVKIP